MKDQPKPASGEWTADRIYSYGVSDADFGVRLAKDINAALAAERELREKITLSWTLAKSDNEELREQLAAERERHQQMERMLTDSVDQMRKDLAAEREKLAAAQAAIAEHNKDFTNQIDSTCYAIPATGLRDYHDVPFPEGTQPTGEWTVESVRLIAVVNTKGAERIVAAHNAALAASELYRAFQKQLAAEQEKVRVLTDQMQKDFQRDLS